MQLTIDQLPAHLKKPLKPLYLIAGDEPLLLGEAIDQLCLAAKEQGYVEREVYHVEIGFDWNALLLAGNSLSLFAQKKLIETRLSGKPGVAGSKVLTALANHLPPDTIFIVRMRALDFASLKSQWYRAIDRQGVVIRVWPIAIDKMGSWLRMRLKKYQMTADQETIQALTERLEGNLLAADQEIQKFKLLLDRDELRIDDVYSGILNNSRHQVFEFVDMALLGRRQKLAPMLANLRDENISPLLILWDIARTVRLLIQHRLGQRGNLFATTYERQAHAKTAAKRQSTAYWQNSLLNCARIDRIAKGQLPGNTWDELLQLGFSLAWPTVHGHS